MPFPPGGSTDIVGRVVADGLSKELGQPVVIENRGGAGGTVGTAVVAKAAPDGHTLVDRHHQRRMRSGRRRCKVAFDPVKGFAPITLVAETPYVLAVNNNVQAKIGVGAGRAGEVAAGQVQLRLGGRRQHHASGRRDVRACSRAEDGAHRL